MIFNKEETKNLITMLQSEDSENHIVAFEALKNVDFKKYTGEILVLYKFGCTDINKWIENCKTISKNKNSFGCLYSTIQWGLFITHDK